MAPACEQCGGSGQLIVQENDRSCVRTCPCTAERKLKRALDAAHIPERHQNCSFDDYRIDFPGVTRSLAMARHYETGFVERYPAETGTTGLIFMGSIGVGKTHLAVAILRALILERGASGLFCDYREFLKQLQQTYSQRGDGSEREILEPVLKTPVLVLDKLGAMKPTEWVMDTVGYVLNTRYNECRTTIITTNYPNLPPLEVDEGMKSFSSIRSVARGETLGDRIGERVRSRLQDMCVPIEMDGIDFRQLGKRASLA